MCLQAIHPGQPRLSPLQATVLVVLHQVEWKKRGKYETETRVVAQDKDNRSAAKSWPFIPR